MATRTWTNNGHAWTDPGAFTPSDPGPSDTALFSGDLFGPIVAGDATVGAISIVSYGPVFTGTVTVENHSALTVDFNGMATFAQGGALATGGVVVVGAQFSGTLELHGSNKSTIAEATSGVVIVGQGTTTSGLAELTGGAWLVSRFMTVGAGGMADLSVSGGGALFIGSHTHGVLIIGKLASATGAVVVSGPGSEIFAAGTIRVGEAGSGLLTVAAKGYLSAGTLDVAGSGAVSLADGYVNVTGSASLSAGSAVTGSGSFGAAAIDNEGTVTARGQLSVGGTISGTGTLAVAQAGVMILTQDVLALQTIAFAASKAELIIEYANGGSLPTIAATITGFTTGDLLLVQGIGSLSYKAPTEALTLVGSDGEQLRFAGLSNMAAFRIVGHQGDLTKIALAHG